MEFTFYDPPPLALDEITEKLYLSDSMSAASKSLLTEKKITHILIVGNHLEKKFPTEFEYLHLPVDDLPSQKLSHHFQEVFDFIEKGERVLVHCAAGVSRSSSMVIAYLMMKNKWDYKTAHSLVKKCRPIIWPNHGFVTQLKELEKTFEKVNAILNDGESFQAENGNSESNSEVNNA